MKKTAIYLRVSSDRQAQEGDSIPAQREALRKYIDERPDLSFAGEYLDDGISGTKATRDELSRLLEDVKSGKVDLIIFTKLDRWFRSVRHYTATQDILDQYGVGWTAVWEPIYDTTTPQGRLIVHQMMSIAQFEAENTGQRIRQVQAYKLTQHEVISGSTPPGYSIREKHLVPNEDAPHVLTAFETYSRTGSLNETMRYIVGLPGLPRSKPAFKRMLRNTLYIGKHPSGIDSFCEPIIPLPLFEDVQRQLSINIKKSQKQTYIFSGIIRCAECGGAFAANTRKRQRGRGSLKIIHQYRCARHYNQKPPQCVNPKAITETALEKYLITNLQQIVTETIIRYEARRETERDTAAQIAALHRKEARLKELFINELITLDEYKRDREEYTRQIAALESAQPAEPAEITEALENLQRIAGEDLQALYSDLTPAERRRFWRATLQAVTVSADRRIEISFLTGSK